MQDVLGMKTCQVGLFRLPGVVFEKGQVSEEKMAEIEEWAKSPQGVGQKMTDVLWSFRTEAQRDWFILKWCDDLHTDE